MSLEVKYCFFLRLQIGGIEGCNGFLDLDCWTNYEVEFALAFDDEFGVGQILLKLGHDL